MSIKNNYNEEIHSDDINEIVSKPPSWLLKRGITFILFTVLLVLGLSFYIKYPDVVYVNLKFNSMQAPKVVIAKSEGNIIRLLAKNESWVTANTNLAFMESTANHNHVLMVLDSLKHYREHLRLDNLTDILSPHNLDLGELQSGYQDLYLSYINYIAANKDGIYDKRKKLIKAEISNLDNQMNHIQETYDLQKRELTLAEAEFEKYTLLAEKKIISPLELQQKEATLLAKRQVIPQIANTIISNRGNILSKNNELHEVDNQITEETKRFLQALNKFISEGESWKKRYVLTAPISGKLIYVVFLQENQYIKTGQEMFYINPIHEEYFGEIYVPQINSSKIKKDQEVLIKVPSYPHHEYGYLRGRISQISDIPVRDSIFLVKVDLVRNDLDSIIKLKPGILADAEIITDDQSVFKRVWLNLTKSLKI